MEAMIKVFQNVYLEFDYINYRGEASRRRVRTEGIYYGATDYHPEKQWLLKAEDLDKGEERIFAMNDMSNVQYH